MTIKERFNIRIERVKDYMTAVANYRDIKQKLALAEQEITKTVDADKVDETFVCIKNYFTTAPATDLFETGDNVYPHTKRCHRFFEKPCPIFNCPFHEKNKQYREYQSLLAEARNVKHATRSAMFERIK